MKISISAFSGKRPKKSAHLLDQSEAQTCLNARVEKGDVRGWRAPLLDESLTGSSYQTIFKYTENSTEHWISNAQDLDWFKSPIAQDAYERLYVSGKQTSGTTYYVTQAGSGTGTGASYANSMSVATHNASTFEPDDTVYVCDSITTYIIPPSSGTSGHQIIYRGDYTGHTCTITGVTTTTGWVESDHAGTYYVSQNSNSSGMVFEDDVLLKKGSAHDALNAGEFYINTATSPDTIYYKPSSGVPTDHTVKVTTSTCTTGVVLDDKSYITVRGFTLKKCLYGIRSVQSTTKSTGLVWHSNSFELCQYSIYTSQAADTTNFTITDNTFSYCGSCILLFSTGADSGYLLTTGEISGNTFTNTGITVVGGTTWTTQISTFTDLECIGLQNVNWFKIYNNTATGGYARGIYLYPETTGTCNYNSIYKNSFSTIGKCNLLVGGTGSTVTGNKIYSNIFSETAGAGETTRPYLVYLEDGSTTGNTFYNNTLVGGKTGLYIATVATYWTIKNNIIANCDTYTIQTQSAAIPSNTTADYNCYYPDNKFRYGTTTYSFADWKTNTSQDSNSVCEDPVFVSASDFHIQTSSPAKDAGVDLGVVYQEDMHGNIQEDFGTAWDMGCYIYGGATSVTTYTDSTDFDETIKVYANDLVSTPFNQDADYYHLGVPAPQAAPHVGLGGTTTRYYCYTYVTAYGEEGAPSSPDGAATVHASPVPITQILDAPERRRITGIRLYRTASGTAGVADFRYVLDADFFSTATDYAVGDFTVYDGILYKCTTAHTAAAWDATDFTSGDDVADSALGAVLASEYYEAPPEGLAGIVMLPNGIAIGFIGNEIYFSEPWLPHAWPSRYALSIDEDIIGIGIFGNNAVLLTKGYPYLITGSAPEQMTLTKYGDFMPCLSKRSITSGLGGVLYVSREGLALADAEGVKIITNEFATPGDWDDYYPTTMHGDFYNGKYIVFYSYSSTSGGIIIDFKNNLWTELPFHAQAGYVSTETGKYYIVVDSESTDSPKPQCIKEWEGDPYNYLYWKWKSRKFLFSSDINLSVARITIDQEFYNAVIELLSDNSYLQTQNASAFSESIAQINGDSATFTGTADDKIKVTIDATDYDDINIGASTSIAEVVTAINTATSGTQASVDSDGYLQIVGEVGVTIADGSTTAQTVVADLFSTAASRTDTAVPLGGSICDASFCDYGILSDKIQNVSDVSISPSIIFKLYSNGTLKFTKTVTDGNIFRLPAGYRTRDCEYQAEGYIPVRKIELATSAAEMMYEQ